MKLATVIAALAAVLLPTPAEAEPAMWIVRDNDSEVILFPTIHLLPTWLEWQTDTVEVHISRADEVWFEVLPDGTDGEDLLGPMIELGFSPEIPLSERLNNQEYTALRLAADRLGLSMEQLDPMRPWLAAMTIAVAEVASAGYEADAGVESVLEEMVDDHTPIRAFETGEQQLFFFADLSEKAERQLLRSAIHQLKQTSAQLDELIIGWSQGDISTLGLGVFDSTTMGSREFYDVFIVSRNKEWTETILRELEGEGTDFIAVGAAHLVGKHGVPALLAANGYQVEGPGFTE